MNTLKRFAVFAGDTYYPGGGWSDFSGSFDTLAEARQHVKEKPHDWEHIIDLTTGEDVS